MTVICPLFPLYFHFSAMLHPASYIPTAPLFSLNLRLLWLFRFEERRELRNISLERFSKGRGVGFGDFGMELKNLGSGAMTLTGQMGLSEWNELPICPVVFSHLSDPLVFLTPWSGAKDNAPPLWIRLYKLYSAFLGRFLYRRIRETQIYNNPSKVS